MSDQRWGVIRVVNLLHIVLIVSSVWAPYAAAQPTTSDQHVIVVVGAPGTEDYGLQFAEWADQWKSASTHTHFTLIGRASDDVSDKEQLKQKIAFMASQKNARELWLVLIGHGTFDGKRSKFNMRGKDLEAKELAEWLKPLSQRIVLVNCASSSSPFINAISGPNRIVVSSTRNGAEYNFSRFGGFIASAINDLVNDLDKDGQTSILEAFCAASQSVAAAYQEDNRLATEHALVDDNGDGRGTPADWFDGIRATRTPKEGLADGVTANQVFLLRRGVDAGLTVEQRVRRNALETQLERLHSRKSQMDETAYLERIEPILVDLARVYETPAASSDATPREN